MTTRSAPMYSIKNPSGVEVVPVNDTDKRNAFVADVDRVS